MITPDMMEEYSYLSYGGFKQNGSNVKNHPAFSWISDDQN
jgi:hypothetical protein